MVTPAQILFMYQMVHKVVRDYCGKYYSINTIALENNIVYMTSRIIYCMFHGKERDWTYSFIKKQINYYLIHDIKEFYQFFMNTDQIMDHSIDITPVSNILKSKRAYRGKEAKASTFFDDMQSLSKAAENNSCQIVIPITKRDC